jgi:hypothetical protein
MISEPLDHIDRTIVQAAGKTAAIDTAASDIAVTVVTACRAAGDVADAAGRRDPRNAAA